MKVKASFRYMVQDTLGGVAWFYGIFLALYLVTFILVATKGGNGSFNGAEIASAIFLFVMGLNSFKEYFGMLLQNGVSRKTMFVARLLAFGATSLLMAVLNLLFLAVLPLLPSINGFSLFNLVYNVSGPSAVVLGLLFNFALYLLFLLVGFCLTTLFYRLNKVGKVAVGAGVPVLLTIVLPAIDTLLFKNAIGHFVGRSLVAALGLKTNQPLVAVLSFLVLSAIFGLFSWLLVRRAIVRS